MNHWSEALALALESGDAEKMKAALVDVPREVLDVAVPQLAAAGEKLARGGQPREALMFFEQLSVLAPEQTRWQLRCSELQLATGQPGAAAESAARAVSLSPGNLHAHRAAAAALEAGEHLRAARDAWRRVLELSPSDVAAMERLRHLDEEVRKQELLERITQSEQSVEPSLQPPSLPEVSFDPAWLLDPIVGADADSRMVEGLRQHLRRYSNLQAPKNAIKRLEHPGWVGAWDRVLEDVAGRSLVFWGSELGVLADRALQRGARVTIIETAPHARRIAAGVIQKNQLLRWHQQHGASLADATEDARRASFEEYSAPAVILAPDAEELRGLHADLFIFPDLDHSILGSGLLQALDRFRQAGGKLARVAPAAVRIFAIAVQWDYPGAGFDLQPVDAMRWSFAPEALDSDRGYVALSEPVEVGRLALGGEEWPHVWQRGLRVARSGRVNAIMFWAEWELADSVRLSAALGADTGLSPAVQFTDPIDVEVGSEIELTITASLTRLSMSASPVPKQLRTARLPSWYVPMLIDRGRNDAYRAALARLHANRPLGRVLDIGAGCGLLSMMAAQTGAEHVDGCEMNPAILQVGREVIARNGLADRIALIGKDCRQLSVPDDLVERADLAMFELFDCSLLGEGVLHFLAYAREHLLQPDARFLPIGALLRAQLIEYRVDNILDVDVNLFNPYRFASGFVNVDASRIVYRPLSAPFDLFRFDFRTAGPLPGHLELETPAIDTGIVGAVLFWFDLQLDEETWVSNAPDASEQLHWKQALQFLPEFSVEQEMVLSLLARHDGASIAFKWNDAGLPQDAASKLPRFDPRLLSEAAELDQRTQQLLQHLTHDPEGARYADVVRVASRFAVDPASHDIDARIAHRFASSFFG